jgi:DNA-binding Lrp family transcriptional regulator
MYKLDLKDRRILSELDMNARIPFTQLSKKVQVSRQVIEYRINKLFEEKVIFGAITIFDSVKVGLFWYRIVFRLKSVTSEQKNEILKNLETKSSIIWLGEVGGNWDLIVNFCCKNIQEFNQILEEIMHNYGKFIMKYEVLTYINVTDLERSYLLNKKGSRKEFFHDMIYKDYKLDAIDIAIMKEISSNAFLTNVAIGSKLKISRNTVKYRIETLIKNKIILGFRLLINPSMLGYSSHMTFLEINQIDLKREKEFYAYLKSIPQVTYIVKQVGDWRFGLEIESKDELEFQEIFVNIRGKFADIISNYDSFLILKDHIVNYFPIK